MSRKKGDDCFNTQEVCPRCKQTMHNSNGKYLICSYCRERNLSVESSIKKRINCALRDEIEKEKINAMSTDELVKHMMKKLENEPIPTISLRERLNHKGPSRKPSGRNLNNPPTASLEPLSQEEIKARRLDVKEYAAMQVLRKSKPIIAIKLQKSIFAISGLIVFETDDLVVGCEIGIWKDEIAREQIRRLFRQGVVVGDDGAGSPPEGQCDVGSGVELQRRCAEDPIRERNAGRCDAEAGENDERGTGLDASTDPNGDGKDQQGVRDSRDEKQANVG